MTITHYTVTTSFSRTLPLWRWLNHQVFVNLGFRSILSTQRIHCDNMDDTSMLKRLNGGGLKRACVTIHTLTFLKVNFFELETTWDVLPRPHPDFSLIGAAFFVRQIEVQGFKAHYPPSVVREFYQDGVNRRTSQHFAPHEVGSDVKAMAVEGVFPDLENQGRRACDAANYPKGV